MATIDLLRFLCAATSEPPPAVSLPGGLSAADTTLLLARCAISPTLPLHARLRATALLAGRPGGSIVLGRVLRAPGATDIVRALAARLIGARAEAATLPALLAAVADAAFPLARCAAARALGACGRHNADAALLVLVAQLHELTNIELVEAAAAGLGVLGDGGAVGPLAGLLGDAALPRLRQMWTAHAPQLAQLPPAAWPLETLPAPASLLVATLLAAGETLADLPGGLDELLLLLASRVSCAAAQALAQIGGAAAREALYVALLSAPRHDDAPALLEGLASIDPAAPLTLLGEPALDPMLRWLVARHCAAVGGIGALDQTLAATAGDAFARGAFALALRGQGAHAEALLRRLAASPDEEPYVREHAIAVLSPESPLAAELLLLPLISSAATPVGVRCAAVAALPARLSDEARALIAGLLRDRQLSDKLHAALLTALSATGDVAVLPLLLRFCQSSAPEAARAAIDGLVALADQSALTVLVGLSQSAGASRSLRLHAAGALLLIGGEEFLSLLRSAVDNGTIATQFQALGYVMRVLPTCPLLYELLQKRTVAMSVRRLIAGTLPADARGADTLCLLLGDDQEAPELRAVAASRLKNDAWPAASSEKVFAALASLAATQSAPPALRWRCIVGIGRASTVVAQRALSAIADADPDTHSRSWAAHTLLAQ